MDMTPRQKFGLMLGTLAVIAVPIWSGYTDYQASKRNHIYHNNKNDIASPADKTAKTMSSTPGHK